MPPGQPHLLARRVERHRQPGQHPVTRSNRVVPQEHLCLGVGKRGGAAVGHRHTFWRSGRSGREDDPRVVSGQRRRGPPAARRAGAAEQARFGDHRDDVGLTENQFGAFVGVVGVDRHVRRAGGQRRKDGLIQRVATRRHPDADPVSAANSASGQPGRAGLDVGDQLAVGELHGAVVDRCGVRVARCGFVDDVDERARARCTRRQQVLGRDLVHRHYTKILKSRLDRREQHPFGSQSGTAPLSRALAIRTLNVRCVALQNIRTATEPDATMRSWLQKWRQLRQSICPHCSSSSGQGTR